MIPGGLSAERYARGIGWAPAREINGMARGPG